MRNPGAIFYAKRTEKVNFLSELLEYYVNDLNPLECPSISVKYLTHNFESHSKGKNNFNKHCAKEKVIFHFNWLTNEKGIDESECTPASEFKNLCLDYGGWQSESFKFQR